MGDIETAWRLIGEDAARWRESGEIAAAVAGDLLRQAADWPLALGWLVTSQLGEASSAAAIRETASNLFADPKIQQAAARDLLMARARNSVFIDHLTVFAASKGFLSLTGYRLANALWLKGDRASAVYLQNRVSMVTGVDIHPAARLGSGLLFDHATGVTIGETSVIEDDVALWHGVTLGSTFTESGDRHPKIRRGAIIAANATILGNIEVGEGAVVAAAALVTKPVPPRVTVAGMPARIVSETVNVWLVEPST